MLTRRATRKLLGQLTSAGLVAVDQSGSIEPSALAERMFAGTTARWNWMARRGRMSKAKDRGTHTQAEWRALCASIGGCARCGSSGELTRDHVVPISRGGSDSIENIQPLCRSCNSAKGTSTADYRRKVVQP